MLWLAVVLSGHFANAGSFVIAKILLSKDLKHPTVYVFFIGALGALSVVLVPFANVHAISHGLMMACAIAGGTFMAALLFFFSALQRGDTSRVVPIVGALIPIWTLLFASLVLGERLLAYQGFGIVLLIFGAILISYEHTPHLYSDISWAEIGLSVGAALLFALSYTVTKFVFTQTEFLNGFLWMRLFAFLAVLPLLFISVTRQSVFGGGGEHTARPGFLFLFGQILGALGFFLLNVGLSLAPSVLVVNALQGVQYAFLFLLVLVLSRIDPLLLHERIGSRELMQKVVAIVIMGIGLTLAAR